IEIDGWGKDKPEKPERHENREPAFHRPNAIEPSLYHAIVLWTASSQPAASSDPLRVATNCEMILTPRAVGHSSAVLRAAALTCVNSVSDSLSIRRIVCDKLFTSAAACRNPFTPGSIRSTAAAVWSEAITKVP